MYENDLYEVIDIYKKGRAKLLRITNQVMLETYHKIGSLMNRNKINDELLLSKFNLTKEDLKKIKLLNNNLSLKELNQYKGFISFDTVIFVIKNTKSHIKLIDILNLVYEKNLSLSDLKELEKKKSISD